MRDERQNDPEPALTPAEHEIATALAALRPAALPVEHDVLLFRAGEAAAQRRAARQIRVWRSAAAVLLVGLGVSLVTRNLGRGSPGSSGQPTDVALTFPHADRVHPARIWMSSNPPATPRTWLSYWFAPCPDKASQMLCMAQNQSSLDLSIPLASDPDDDSRIVNFSLGLER